MLVVVDVVFILDWGHRQLLGGRDSGRGWSAGCNGCDIDVLDHDLATDGGRDDVNWVLTLVVHMSQGIVQLEVRVSDGAGAEEDRDGEGGTHSGGRLVNMVVVVL